MLRLHRNKHKRLHHENEKGSESGPFLHFILLSAGDEKKRLLIQGLTFSFFAFR